MAVAPPLAAGRASPVAPQTPGDDAEWVSPWRALLPALGRGRGSRAQPSPSRCVHTVPEMAWGSQRQQSQNGKQGFRHTGVTRVKDTHAMVRGRDTSWLEVNLWTLASRAADWGGRTVLPVAVPGFGLLGVVCTGQSV